MPLKAACLIVMIHRYGSQALHSLFAGIDQRRQGGPLFLAETIALQLQENRDLVAQIVAQTWQRSATIVEPAAVTFPMAVGHWLRRVGIEVDDAVLL